MHKVKLKEVVSYSNERIPYKELKIETYVSTDNLLQNKLGVTQVNQLPASIQNTPCYRKGDILVSNIRPYLKKIHFAKNKGGASADVLIFKVKKDIDSKYIYYNLFQDSFFDHMMAGSKGTKMPRGDKNQILDFEIPNHSLGDQQKIAKVLSDLDAKIELNNRINAELEAMAKLVYEYWFVQFDFPDQNSKPYKSSGGKMVWNEELKREIPEGWDVSQLSTHLNCNKNTLRKSDDLKSIKYLDTSNLTENRIEQIQEIDLINDSIPSRAQRVVKKNDILFSTVRPNLHHYGIIKEPIENLIASTGFSILSHKKSELFNDFFYLFITSESSLKKLEAIAGSSVSSYPSINYSDILNLVIALPSKMILVEKISKLLSSYFSAISLRQIENQQLSSLRDWLLPMLMNGQVSVDGAEERVEEELGMVAERNIYNINPK